MVFLAQKSIPLCTKDLLSWIFDEPRYDQDEPKYIDAKDTLRTISLRQARLIVRRLVAGLRDAGLSQGDCVCLHSFNDIYYSMVFLGIVGSGGVFTGTNPSYTEFELIHHIKTSKTKFIITEPEMLDTMLAAAKACGIPRSNVWIFDVLGQPIPGGFKSWNDLLGHGETDWVRFDNENTCKRTTAARLFSSGTTGLPKAVILSHHNFIAQHTLFLAENERPFQTKRLIALPFFHAASVPVVHTSTLKAGHAAYVMRRFELEAFLANIERFQITEFTAVPPVVIAILMSGLGTKYSLKSVKVVQIGAAPLGKASQERFRLLLPQGALVSQVWGLTESTCVASVFPYPEDDSTGSVGRIVSNVDVKLVDDDGNDITAYDIRGEMFLRGPIITEGYFENVTANTESFDAEGFFKTGDIMYCDGKTKKWYVVDRKKELIKVRGFQIAPPELESVLLSHPQIIDCGVIGVVDPLEPGVELPRAYVVKRPGPEAKDLGEEGIKAYCGSKLSKYKELTGGVRFLEAIPRNPSGKILKRVLRDMAKEEAEQTKAKL